MTPPPQNLLPSDAYLGPAMGKVTVYEQRAKLLFELDRAAQRAGQQRTLVQQLKHTAATSGDEVAHLRGLLQVWCGCLCRCGVSVVWVCAGVVWVVVWVWCGVVWGSGKALGRCDGWDRGVGGCGGHLQRAFCSELYSVVCGFCKRCLCAMGLRRMIFIIVFFYSCTSQLSALTRI
jgi:hypothetical protein